MKKNNTNNEAHEFEGDKWTLSVKEILLKYLRFWPLFLGSTILALTASYVYLRYASPQYRVLAKLQIKNDNKNSNEKFTELFLFKPSSNIDNEIEILRSQTLMKRVVNKLDLNVNYFAIGNVKIANIYKDVPIKLFVKKINDSLNGFSLKVKIINNDSFLINEGSSAIPFNSQFKTPQGEFVLCKVEPYYSTFPYKEYTLVWQPDDVKASSLLRDLSIRPVTYQSNVLELSFTTDNPVLGADVLNQLIAQYDKSNIEDKNEIAAKTIAFIDDRLGIITNELGDVEQNLQHFKQKNEVINIASQTDAFFDNMKDVQEQGQELEIKIGVVDLMENYLSDKSKQYDLVSSSLGIDDPSLIEMIAQYNNAQLERERQIKLTTPQNPIVKVIEEGIEKLRINLITQLKNIRKSLVIARDNNASKNKAFRSQIAKVPEKEKVLLDISRQQGIKQSLYLFLLQKREETAMTLASTISNSRVVDPASYSKQPFAPQKKKTYMFVLAVGLLIPVLIIYAKDVLNDKVLTKGDIEKFTDAPIIGEVGHVDEKDGRLILKQNDRSLVSEQFRIVRTNLQYFITKEKRPVILITSTFSGEGKSFVSTNLGAVMALGGKKTVILELDIRKPKIASSLQLNRSKGITNYIVGTCSLDELAIPVPDVPNLYVMPCGPIPPNPSELLLDEKVNALFEYVNAHFDMVLIDSAPTGLVSDATVLGNYANCTLYIVRQRYTYKKQINFIESLYKNKRLPKISILVNDVEGKGTGYYGYGNYGYGYGKGYAYGT